MSAPKLKMIDTDINIAIARQFKKDMAMLKFTPDSNIISVDKDGDCSLFLQNRFAGLGNYYVSGCVKLVIQEVECQVSKLFNVNFEIQITETDGSPSIKIFSPISIKNK